MSAMAILQQLRGGKKARHSVSMMVGIRSAVPSHLFYSLQIRVRSLYALLLFQPAPSAQLYCDPRHSLTLPSAP